MVYQFLLQIVANSKFVARLGGACNPSYVNRLRYFRGSVD